MVVGSDTVKNEFVLEESFVTERTQDVRGGLVERVMVAEPLLAKEASQQIELVVLSFANHWPC